MTWKEKLQIALAFLMLVLLGVYLVILLGALVSTVAELWPEAEPATQSAPPGDGQEGGAEGGSGARPWELAAAAADYVRAKAGKIATFIALLLPALGFVVPSRSELRQRLVESATLVTALILYFQAGERRRVLSGWLQQVFEKINELDDVQYSRTRIISYSFGSIVALDTLFPYRDKPGPRLEQIDSLVTIGSPFDFVQLIWPRYFEDRVAPKDLRWLNLYAPEDVLSSNFRTYSKARTEPEPAPKSDSEPAAGDGGGDDDRVLKWTGPPENVKYRLRMGRDELSWWEPFLFLGLRNHTLYWEPGDVPQVNAFDAVVTRVWEGDRVLR
jgi:hypothetical protein